MLRLIAVKGKIQVQIGYGSGSENDGSPLDLQDLSSLTPLQSSLFKLFSQERRCVLMVSSTLA